MAIVELKWDCTSCDSKGILGRHARCPGCGSPREKGEMGSMGKYLKEAEKKDASQNPALSKELISRGKAGADWFCARCESGNGNRDERCTSCASPREGIAVEDHPNFKGAHKGAKPLERDGYGEVEKSISQPTGGSSSEEKKYNPWPGPHRFPPKSPPPISPSDMAVVSGIGCVPLIPIAALIGGLGLLGYGIWWCFQTSEVEARVKSLEWVRTVAVQEFQPKTVRSFRSETQESDPVMPDQGVSPKAGMVFLGSCAQEHHHYRNYECSTSSGNCCSVGDVSECKDVTRTETESYSCTKSESYSCTKQDTVRVPDGQTCRDLGNGFADCETKYRTETVTVPDTCTRQVPDTCYRDKEVFDHRECDCKESIKAEACDYQTFVWNTTKVLKAEGQGTSDIHWPVYDDTPKKRFLKDQNFTITLEYLDGGVQSHTETTSDLEDYKQWASKEVYKADLYNMGGLEEIHRE